jgi:hypothetical protein
MISPEHDQTPQHALAHDRLDIQELAETKVIQITDAVRFDAHHLEYELKKE